MSAKILPPVTDWFPPEILPVREGWYERDYGREHMNRLYDRWNGSHWMLGGKGRGKVKSVVERRWRGLSAPAKVKP